MIVDRFPWLLEPNILTVLIRTLMALICAGMIGSERNLRGAAAGMRTHILVCLGAMLAMTTGQFAFLHYGTVDPTRIGAQVVSGIGFLGAGSIIVTRGNRVHGLTTAAGLWASACIGLAIGIGFYETINRNNDGLYQNISEGGSNLSVGEKQLICITRGILRKTKIFVLDEATASIDMKTEKIIQKVLNEILKDSTMIIIAHRIKTVENADKILCLNNGEIVEFDTPMNLKKNKHSYFYELLSKSK